MHQAQAPGTRARQQRPDGYRGLEVQARESMLTHREEWSSLRALGQYRPLLWPW